MRVICPACGISVKINSEREIALHYPPTDEEDEDYELVCEASGQEYEDEDEE